MEYVTLNNGVRMPLLGYGVYQMEDAGLCRRCVGEAITTGYRLIDTAAVYLNEEAVGKAVEVSGVPRSEFFITSKVWIQDMGYEQTLRAFDRSLARLGMDYLDLYLLHMPFGDVFGAWKAMERLYREGRVRAVGVCNFRIPRLADLMAHFEVVPAVNQVETHLFNQQQAMQRYAGSKGGWWRHGRRSPRGRMISSGMRRWLCWLRNTGKALRRLLSAGLRSGVSPQFRNQCTGNVWRRISTRSISGCRTKIWR